MDVAYDLAGQPQVIGYFAALFWALFGCYQRCSSKVALLLAASTLVVTWGLILRYTVDYKRSAEGMQRDNLFDDAYVDVLEGDHFGTSAQLLTWVVVAVVWTHDAPAEYMTFGALGAMSAAFFMWVPQVTLGAQKGKRAIPICYALTSAIAM